MSIVERRPPPLIDGQRLNQAEFLRRYEATPPGFKAELIGGVVHVPSPLSRPHGRGSFGLTTWLGVYQARTPGVEGLENTTTVMDELGVPQPDVQLRILPECGGQTRNEGQYVAGAPELVVEVAKSSRTIDLGTKRADYQRVGVKEYVVVTLDPDEVHWHVRRGKTLVRVRPGRDGLYRSKVFPGLWLDPAALLRKDLTGVLAALDRGLATPEHAEFVARLAAAARAQPGE
jgi:Uma2 family endonuclease